MASRRSGLLIAVVVALVVAGVADVLALDLIWAPRYLAEREGAHIASAGVPAPVGPVAVAQPAPSPQPGPSTDLGPASAVETTEEVVTGEEPAALPEPTPEPAALPEPTPEPAALPEPTPEPSERARRFPRQVPDARFASESTSLGRVSRRHLWTAVWIMRRDRGLRLVVRGHSDATGSEAGNLELSRVRAEVASRFIIDRGGIDPSRVDVEHVGSRQPAAPGSSPGSLARNRRVELLWR